MHRLLELAGVIGNPADAHPSVAAILLWLAILIGGGVALAYYL